MTDEQANMIHQQLGKLTEMVASLADVIENANLSRLVNNVAKLNEAVGNLNDTVNQHIRHSIETINEQGKTIAQLKTRFSPAE